MSIQYNQTMNEPLLPSGLSQSEESKSATWISYLRSLGAKIRREQPPPPISAPTDSESESVQRIVDWGLVGRSGRTTQRQFKATEVIKPFVSLHLERSSLTATKSTTPSRNGDQKGDADSDYEQEPTVTLPVPGLPPASPVFSLRSGPPRPAPEAKEKEMKEQPVSFTQPRSVSEKRKLMADRAERRASNKRTQGVRFSRLEGMSASDAIRAAPSTTDNTDASDGDPVDVKCQFCTQEWKQPYDVWVRLSKKGTKATCIGCRNHEKVKCLQCSKQVDRRVTTKIGEGLMCEECVKTGFAKIEDEDEEVYVANMLRQLNELEAKGKLGPEPARTLPKGKEPLKGQPANSSGPGLPVKDKDREAKDAYADLVDMFEPDTIDLIRKINQESIDSNNRWKGPNPLAPKLDGKSYSMIDNHENRRLKTRFAPYKFKLLKFLGLWNDTVVGTNLPFANHAGLFYHQSEHVIVFLPCTIVSELGSFWAHKTHKDDYANWDLSVIKCRNLLRVLDITSEQHRLAMVYAPAIAYLTYWAEQQNVSRVVFEAYWKWHKVVRWLTAIGAGVLTVATVGLFFGSGGTAALVLGLGGGALLAGAAGYNYWKANYDHKRTAPLIGRAENSFPEVGPSNPLASMVVKERTDRKPEDEDKRGVALTQTGPVSPGNRPVVFESNLHNEKEAVKKRVLELQLSGPRTSECIRYLKENHVEIFGRKRRIEPLPVDVWLERVNCTPAVRAWLRKVAAALVELGIDHRTSLTREQLKKWTKRKSFIKREKLAIRNFFKSKKKAPRLIQGAQAEFSVLTGPFIMALQGYLKEKMNKEGLIITGSGMLADTLAEIITSSDNYPDLDCAGEDDLAHYDVSISEEWCAYELWFCDQYESPQATKQLMRANVATHGATTRGVAYQVPGTRKSGDPYTSLFNGIDQGGAHLWAFAVSRGTRPVSGGAAVPLTAHECKGIFRQVVVGDDNAIRHNGPPIDWKPLLASVGFEATPVYRQTNYELEFCSSRPVPCMQGVVMAPKVGRVMASLGWTVDKDELVPSEAYLVSAVKSQYEFCHVLPPLRALFDRILELCKVDDSWLVKVDRRARVKFSHDQDWKFKPKRCDADMSTFECLHEIYGWTPDNQLGYERFLSSTTDPLKLMDYPRLVCFLDKDTDGPQLIFDPAPDNFGEWCPFVEDLTEEGVEPNPGPCACVFCSQCCCDDCEQGRLDAAMGEYTWARTMVSLHRVLGRRSHPCKYSIATNSKSQCFRGASWILSNASTGCPVEPPPYDLTREGIEPNPGPGRGTSRRSSRKSGGRSSSRGRSRSATPRGGPRRVKTYDGPRRSKSRSKSRARSGSRNRKGNRGGPTVAPPTSFDFNNKSNGAMKARGQSQLSMTNDDYWSNIPGGTIVAGQVLSTTSLALGNLGPRTRAQALLWEKWRANLIKFKYISAVPTTQAGTLIMFIDPDPLTNWATVVPSPLNLQRARVQTGSCEFSVWNTGECALKADRMAGDLFTAPQTSDPRLSIPGTFVIMAVTGFTSASDLGSLTISTDLSFSKATYNQAAVPSSLAYNGTSQPLVTTSWYSSSGLVAPGISSVASATNEYYSGGAPLGVCTVSEPVQSATVTAALGGATSSRNVGGSTAPGSTSWALPAGEWLVEFDAGVSANATSIPSLMNSWTGPGVKIEEIECSGGVSSGPAGSGFATTALVTVTGEAESKAHVISANEYTLSGSGVPASSAEPTSADWGLFDFLFNPNVNFNFSNALVSVAESVLPLLFALGALRKHGPDSKIAKVLMVRRSISTAITLDRHTNQRQQLQLSYSALFGGRASLLSFKNRSELDDDEKTLSPDDPKTVLAQMSRMRDRNLFLENENKELRRGNVDLRQRLSDLSFQSEDIIAESPESYLMVRKK